MHQLDVNKKEKTVSWILCLLCTEVPSWRGDPGCDFSRRCEDCGLAVREGSSRGSCRKLTRRPLGTGFAGRAAVPRLPSGEWGWGPTWLEALLTLTGGAWGGRRRLRKGLLRNQRWGLRSPSFPPSFQSSPTFRDQLRKNLGSDHSPPDLFSAVSPPAGARSRVKSLGACVTHGGRLGEPTSMCIRFSHPSSAGTQM